jgi:hypothetical protein
MLYRHLVLNLDYVTDFEGAYEDPVFVIWTLNKKDIQRLLLWVEMIQGQNEVAEVAMTNVGRWDSFHVYRTIDLSSFKNVQGSWVHPHIDEEIAELNEGLLDETTLLEFSVRPGYPRLMVDKFGLFVRMVENNDGAQYFSHDISVEQLEEMLVGMP